MEERKEDINPFMSGALQRRRQSLPASIHSSLGVHLLQDRFAKANLGQELSPGSGDEADKNKMEHETVTKISPEIADLIKKYRRTGSAFVSKRSWYKPTFSPRENGVQMPNYRILQTRRNSLEPLDFSPRPRGRPNSSIGDFLSLSPRLKSFKDSPRTSLGGNHKGKRPSNMESGQNCEFGEVDARINNRANSLSPKDSRKHVVRVEVPQEADPDSSSDDSSRSPSPNPLEMSRLQKRRHTVDGIPDLPRGILKPTPRIPHYNQHSVWDQTLEECSKKFGNNAQENIPDGSDVYKAAMESLKLKKTGKTVHEKSGPNDEDLENVCGDIKNFVPPEPKIGTSSNKIINPAPSPARRRRVQFQ